jgi:integrase
MERHELSTGCTTENDAHIEAAKLVLKTYRPLIPANPRSTTWDKALAELIKSPGLRPDSIRNYRTVIQVLRSILPETNGPNEITVEHATRFKRLYLQGTTVRGKGDSAKKRARSPVSCRTYLRSLRSLWSRHFKELGYVRENPWLDVDYPDVAKKEVVIPTEDTFSHFTTWLLARYPNWALPRLFVTVKSLSGCRTLDLCQVRSEQLRNGKLTFTVHQTKTKRARTVPLPADLCEELRRVAGPTYLWERYTEDAKVYRPGRKMRDAFDPKTLYWAISNIFREYNAGFPERRVKPHDLRKRALTLTTLATQSVDATADAIGIDPQTARRYYLDATQSFNGEELLKRMAEILRPKTAPESRQNSIG